MKKFDFVVCYDISSPKRLIKVAKYLEAHAIRIQKSIFFYPQATKAKTKELVDKLNRLIDSEQDDVRIYQIDSERSLWLESAIDLTNPTIT